MCATDDIGDEHHYLFTWDLLRVTEDYFYVKSNIRQYMEPFTSTNEATLIKLLKFVAIMMEKFSV